MYFWLFMIFSIVGWIGEMIFCKIINKKFINRGFLMGPYCPIYGCGIVLLTLILNKYADDPFILFCASIVICAVVEYVASFLMESIFKLRWWDYSNIKFNINGRICLESVVPFGIIGVIVIIYINPFLISLLEKIPSPIFNILTVILVAIFTIDVIISSNVIFNFKDVINGSKKDSTEEIKKLIKKELPDNKVLYNRLINAFPNLKRIVKEKTDKGIELTRKFTEKTINKIKKKAKKK